MCSKMMLANLASSIIVKEPIWLMIDMIWPFIIVSDWKTNPFSKSVDYFYTFLYEACAGWPTGKWKKKDSSLSDLTVQLTDTLNFSHLLLLLSSIPNLFKKRLLGWLGFRLFRVGWFSPNIPYSSARGSHCSVLFRACTRHKCWLLRASLVVREVLNCNWNETTNPELYSTDQLGSMRVYIF